MGRIFTDSRVSVHRKQDAFIDRIGRKQTTVWNVNKTYVLDGIVN